MAQDQARNFVEFSNVDDKDLNNLAAGIHRLIEANTPGLERSGKSRIARNLGGQALSGALKFVNQARTVPDKTGYYAVFGPEHRLDKLAGMITVRPNAPLRAFNVSPGVFNAIEHVPVAREVMTFLMTKMGRRNHIATHPFRWNVDIITDGTTREAPAEVAVALNGILQSMRTWASDHSERGYVSALVDADRNDWWAALQAKVLQEAGFAPYGAPARFDTFSRTPVSELANLPHVSQLYLVPLEK